jgi:hypothetical protein
LVVLQIRKDEIGKAKDLSAPLRIQLMKYGDIAQGSTE